jgi:hypothetical protein
MLYMWQLQITVARVSITVARVSSTSKSVIKGPLLHELAPLCNLHSVYLDALTDHSISNQGSLSQQDEVLPDHHSLLRLGQQSQL